MRSSKHKYLAGLVSFLLALITPLAQAQQFVLPEISRRALDFSKIEGSSETIWDQMAAKLYEDEVIGDIPAAEKEALARLFFADYLGYLNAIGLELASTENSIAARKEIRQRGECSDETIEAFNKLLTNSVQSDLYTFMDNYCSNACRQKAEMDFSLIATFEQPEGLPQTCADRAREMYDSYHCNLYGDTGLNINDVDLRGDGGLIPSPGMHSSVAVGVGSDERFSPKGLPSLQGTTARVDPDLPIRGGVGSSTRFVPVPKLGTLSRVEIDREFKNVLSKQKRICSQKRSDLLRQTYANPDAWNSSSPTPLVRDPKDPRWTTRDQPRPEVEKKIETTVPKNPACKSSGAEMFDHFATLRRAYSRIADERIESALGYWPIYDDKGNINKEVRNSIRRIADMFFHALLSDIEAQNREACGAGGSALISDMGSSSATIHGQNYTVTIRSGDPGRIITPSEGAEEAEEVEPVTVATYFSANDSLVEALMNGIIGGAAQTGVGTHTQVRAGQIAAGVQNGSIPPEDIPVEAAKGPLGRNASEIEKLTKQYLAQGSYQGFKVALAEIMGGVLTGTAISGTTAGVRAVGSKLTAAGSSGQISAAFISLQRAIMIPMLAGGESGAISLSLTSMRKALTSASLPYKGSTKLGHALSKHAGRNPHIWGRISGAMNTWHKQGLVHYRDIMKGPGYFEQVTYDGITFWEKRLSDGRGMRLNLDFTFKGFLD